MAETEKHVEYLIAKAAGAEKSEDAQRLSQAALNAAHAIQVLHLIEVSKRPEDAVAI